MQFCYFLEAKAGITRPWSVQGSRKGMTTSKVIILLDPATLCRKLCRKRFIRIINQVSRTRRASSRMNFPHRPVVTLAPEMGLINALRSSSVQNQFSPSDIHRLSRAKTTRINKMTSKRKIFDLLSNSLD